MERASAWFLVLASGGSQISYKQAWNKWHTQLYSLALDPDNAEAIAEELGAKVASSLDELVSSDEVDCVIVATPNNLHKEPVIKAAQHGKNVFCEKPIALSYQDCREMVDACKENNGNPKP